MWKEVEMRTLVIVVRDLQLTKFPLFVSPETPGAPRILLWTTHHEYMNSKRILCSESPKHGTDYNLRATTTFRCIRGDVGRKAERWTRWEGHSGSIRVWHVCHSHYRFHPAPRPQGLNVNFNVGHRSSSCALPQVWTKLVVHLSFEVDAAGTHVIPDSWLSLDLLVPRWDGLRQPCMLVPVEATTNSPPESPSSLLCLRVKSTSIRTLLLSTPPPPSSSERWLSPTGSFIPQMCSRHLLRVVMRFGW